MARLSVHLVAWNGAKYIPYLFESLRKQTYKDWELLAINNASTKDNTADLIEKEILDFPVPARLIRNKENNGFAGGHNQAVRLSCAPPLAPPPQGGEIAKQFPPLTEGRLGGVGEISEYIQLLNQDMYLAPDYFEKVVKMMDNHPKAGAGQGLLLRWEFVTNTHSEVIDTMGLKVMRSRRVVDFRTGEQVRHPESQRDEGSPTNVGDRAYARDSSASSQNDENVVEVFGVSGALPIYRRKAIDEVSFEGTMFDDEFGSYKEDVDLAFRLRSAGWKAFVEINARAWHDRTAAGPREKSDTAAMKNRKGRPSYVNYYSYRNHLVVLLKNEHRANFAKDWPKILWYEFKKFLFILCFDRATLKGLREVKAMMPRIIRKRQFIMEHYKVKPKEMRKWYV